MEINIEVDKIHILPKSRYLKAFVDIVIDKALLVKGFKVIDGHAGLFITMPKEKYKDKEWCDSVRCLNNDVETLIFKTVLKAYLFEECFSER